MTARPEIHDDPMYQLLRQEQIEAFNAQRTDSNVGKLATSDFRGLDLRELNAEGLDLSDAYFRGADLRGIDFRQTNLEGASFCEAKISGCYFPKALCPSEIRMSIELGCRVRYKV